LYPVPWGALRGYPLGSRPLRRAERVRVTFLLRGRKVILVLFSKRLSFTFPWTRRSRRSREGWLSARGDRQRVRLTAHVVAGWFPIQPPRPATPTPGRPCSLHPALHQSNNRARAMSHLLKRTRRRGSSSRQHPICLTMQHMLRLPPPTPRTVSPIPARPSSRTCSSPPKHTMLLVVSVISGRTASGTRGSASGTTSGALAHEPLRPLLNLPNSSILESIFFRKLHSSQLSRARTRTSARRRRGVRAAQANSRTWTPGQPPSPCS
jgi:hypothetical protein